MKHLPLILDLIKPRYNKPFYVKNDEANSISLDINILANEVPIDLTDSTVRLMVKSPSGVVSSKDCSITSITSGLCEVVLDDIMYSEFGEHVAEVRIIKETEVMISEKFSYFSLDSIL